MNKIWLHIRVFLASLLILSACAEIDQPLGSIDTVVKIETKWLCDANGNKKLIVYNKEYDNSGRLLKVTEYDSIGIAKLVRKIQYDNSGCKETAQYFNTIGNIDSTKIFNSIVNSDGNISKKVEVNLQGDTVAVSNYRYDGKGNLVYSKSVSLKNKATTETNYEYNQAGSLSTSIQKDGVTGFIQKKDSLVYNSSQSSIDKIVMDSNGTTQVVLTLIYDRFGKIYKEIENNPNGKVIRTFIYDYIYY